MRRCCDQGARRVDSRFASGPAGQRGQRSGALCRGASPRRHAGVCQSRRAAARSLTNTSSGIRPAGALLQVGLGPSGETALSGNQRLGICCCWPGLSCWPEPPQVLLRRLSRNSWVRRDQLAAFRFTPFRNATVFSLVLAAFSSFRFVVKNLTTSSWPNSSAHAIKVP